MNTLVSVVVCTFNRARLLSACLDSLSAQSQGGQGYEIIVVDNNSTDATSQIVKDFARTCPNLRFVTEPKQGLSHARNCGWIEARGRYVAYIDDDAKAKHDWLDQMLSFIERHPEVAAFGGPHEAHTEVAIPLWFPPGYGTMDLGDQERPISVGKEFITGTNMVFRREVLAEFGGFNPALGMVGSRILYGEETRLLREIAEGGVTVYYVPSMRVSHLIAAKKMRLGWFLYSSYCNGRSAAETFRQGRSFGSHLYGVTGEFIKAPFRLIHGAHLPLKRNMYQAFSGFFSELGALVDCLASSRRPD